MAMVARERCSLMKEDSTIIIDLTRTSDHLREVVIK